MALNDREHALRDGPKAAQHAGEAQGRLRGLRFCDIAVMRTIAPSALERSIDGFGAVNPALFATGTPANAVAELLRSASDRRPFWGRWTCHRGNGNGAC